MAAVQPIYWQTTVPKYGDRVSKIATSGRFPYTCILTSSTRHLPFDHYRLLQVGKKTMFEKRKTQTLEQVNRISFAFLVGNGAAAGMGIKTGHLGIGIATGIAVFLIFGLGI
jgi:hypothetical protein